MSNMLLDEEDSSLVFRHKPSYLLFPLSFITISVVLALLDPATWPLAGFFGCIGCMMLIQQCLARRNRCLILTLSGLTYYDWRGRLEVTAVWEDVLRVESSVDAGVSEPGHLRIRCLKDTVDILGLQNEDEIVKIVKSRLVPWNPSEVTHSDRP